MIAGQDTHRELHKNSHEITIVLADANMTSLPFSPQRHLLCGSCPPTLCLFGAYLLFLHHEHRIPGVSIFTYSNTFSSDMLRE